MKFLMKIRRHILTLLLLALPLAASAEAPRTFQEAKKIGWKL